jgi:hypothetical protein
MIIIYICCAPVASTKFERYLFNFCIDVDDRVYVVSTVAQGRDHGPPMDGSKFQQVFNYH